ncbi:hypothetical protein A4X09_0g3592 [Tilletia walkeri]|uniref:DUF6589 domain-containing protein n=1 Tax=Tilletia walkeri TaxID=117179 RepID=A0A8X7N8M3_9BASI|nr:hypothetical protein A4X09_0g3592 [Tilletia walkeri]
MSAIKASNFGLCHVSPNSGKEGSPVLLHEWGSALDSKLAHGDLTPDSSNDVDWPPASWTMYRELVPGPYLMKLAEAATVHHSVGLGTLLGRWIPSLTTSAVLTPPSALHSELFRGVPSSSPLRNTSPPQHGPSGDDFGLVDELELEDIDNCSEDSDDEEDGSDDVPARLRASSKNRSKIRKRRDVTMSERDIIDLLRFLKARNLGLTAVANLFLLPKKAPPARSEYGSIGHSSQPSALSSDPYWLHCRIAQLYGTDFPRHVADRWSGIDDYAVDRACNLVRKESKTLVKDKYLKGPNAKNIRSEDLSSFEFNHGCNIMSRVGPASTRILHAMAGDKSIRHSQDQDRPPPRKKSRLFDTQELGDDMLSDDDDDGKKDGKLWVKGGSRSKSNLAFTAHFMLLFAFSQHCNRYQQSIGAVLFGARVPKRPMELLSRAGICVSVKTIAQEVSSLAKDSLRITRELLQDPSVVVSLSIDNLNWLSTVRDKTSTSRNTMMAAVAGNFYVIDGSVRYSAQPKCSTTLFSLIFGNDFHIPSSQSRPISPLNEEGRPIAMDRKLLDEARRSIMRDNVFDAGDFVLGSSDQRHLIEATVSHALRSWIDLHPECAELANMLPQPPQIFPLEPKATTVRPLPVYDEDEGSIAGNIRVLDNICDDFQLSEQWLSEHIVPAIGDAFTATLQRKAIDRRADDRSPTPERHRIKYLKPWAAFFHFQYAYQKFLIDIHSGTASAMDLLSFRRVSSKAGFKNLTTGNIDFHDVDAFCHTYFAAISEVVITTKLRAAGHGRKPPPPTSPPSSPTSGPSAQPTPAENDASTSTDTASPAPHHGIDMYATQQTEAGNETQPNAFDPDATLQAEVSGDEDDPEDDPDATLCDDSAREAICHDPVIAREQTLAMPEGGAREDAREDNEFEDLEWDDLRSAASTAIQDIMRGGIGSLCEGVDANSFGRLRWKKRAGNFWSVQIVAYTATGHCIEGVLRYPEDFRFIDDDTEEGLILRSLATTDISSTITENPRLHDHDCLGRIRWSPPGSSFALQDCGFRIIPPPLDYPTDSTDVGSHPQRVGSAHTK